MKNELDSHDSGNDVRILREALAKNPTSGPWMQGVYSGATMPWVCDDTGVEIARTQLIRALDDDHITNAEFIAACSPDRIARLIEHVDKIDNLNSQYVCDIMNLTEQVKEYEAALKKIYEYRSDTPDWNMVMAIAEDAIAPKQIVLSGQREGGLK